MDEDEYPGESLVYLDEQVKSAQQGIIDLLRSTESVEMDWVRLFLEGWGKFPS
jgi:hypothetical protein